jgi:hypothetical protein
VWDRRPASRADCLRPEQPHQIRPSRKLPVIPPARASPRPSPMLSTCGVPEAITRLYLDRSERRARHRGACSYPRVTRAARKRGRRRLRP